LRPAAGHRLHGGKPGKEGGRPASAPPDRGAARPGAAAGAAAVRPGGPAAPDPARDRPAFGHQPQLCVPPGVPRAGPAAPELEKLKVPCLCPAVRPQRALPAGVGERGEGYQQGVLGEVFANAYRSGTFGSKASCFCAPIFFSAQLSWAPSTPTRPRASCCWTRKSNPHHSKTPDAYKRPG